MTPQQTKGGNPQSGNDSQNQNSETITKHRIICETIGKEKLEDIIPNFKKAVKYAAEEATRKQREVMDSGKECKTCHKPLITDWHEGDCIKCARDKVLGDSGKEWEWALKELGWDEPEYGWTKEKMVLKTLLQESREEVLDYLLEHGHGGGNWRRLILQLKEKSI